VVEPITLGVVVAALAAKALERAEDAAVDEAAGVVRRIVDALRSRFGDSGDDEGATALDRLADAPDSPARMRALAELVDRRADRSPALRDELDALAKEARRAGVDVDSISQAAIGNQNVQIAGLNDSQVTIAQERSPRSND